MLAVRKFSARREWALVAVVAMFLSGLGPAFVAPVHAQTAPIGNGFVIDAGDIRFIYQQILVAQDHAAGGQLLGPGPNQVGNAQLPRGLRTVDGSYNNLVTAPDQHMFGAADRLFPRLTAPLFRDAEQGTSYKQKLADNIVVDSQPRVITNLIVDQSAKNPAALAAAQNPCGSGGFVCSNPEPPDPDSGALFIPNITPDFGLSAPFNLMFAFFGQFFDHGLDLVTKGGGTVLMPLQPDDPLYVAGSQTNFMVMTRGQNQPGPDGKLGTADDIQEGMNTTTPWVDQNQTYTSHPSHQVFLRQYAMVNGAPVPDGKVLDGDHCAPRGTGIPGDEICNIGNWGDVKRQAATKLGIQLVDQDVFDVPLISTDPYGHFKPGPHGFPQMIRPNNVLVEGDPTANGGAGVLVPADAFRTGHAFLNDIAHNAVPNPGLTPDSDTAICDFRTVPSCQEPGTYDDELLAAHFITGDGRGNENIALTMVHNLFHAEHNRLVNHIDKLINTPGFLTPAEVTAWHAPHPASGWGYGERLFQAARFVTEMEYQHLVFEEFARTIQPLINPFLGGLTSIDGAISAEFAHTVYRLGHSMLPERVDRINTDGSHNEVRLLNAFLNPPLYNDGGPAGTLTAAQAAGSIIDGTSKQVGNELDEFVTSSVRDSLVGLPLDLAAINIARGRSEGIKPLNLVRTEFYNLTKDATVQPYANWFEFGLALRHSESLVNFVAAYGTHPNITGATTVVDKRAAAAALVAANDPFLFSAADASGLNSVDFWVGGLAEKPAVFGGLLGATFNFVFEHQLEHLQDGDRFYYLQRTDGLNLRFSLEGNSLAELARRNSTAGDTMNVIFQTADFTFKPGDTLDPATHNGMTLLTLTDGTMVFFDPLHSGKNITFSGGPGDDRFRSDVGDDTLFGNAGNDRFDGGEGNDTLIGGDGDDILFGQNGDDTLKGGPGNDALSTGPGFGADLAIGGDGNDFMVGGDDGVEYFGGPGNDIIVDGSMRSEGMFGGPGDDWIYDGDGHDGGMFGDGGNVFDLLAGLDQVGGDDVEGGGPGQDNHFGEGGDDIFLMSEGSNKFFGDYGFDWFTMRGWASNLSATGEPTASSVAIPGDIQLNLLAVPGVILNFNDLRNFFRFTDGGSGWDADDHIQGDENTADPAAPLELLLQPQMGLTVEGAQKIAGLTDLVTNGFGKVATNAPVDFFDNAGGNSTLVETRHMLWIGGNILLGGLGSDIIEGRGGDDLIDGDLWLNVQLKATLNDGTVKLVNDPRSLVEDVFADPQRLNPGNIEIVRSIVTPTNVPPPDCGSAAPLNCDTAVFSGPRADYVITQNANGTVTVFHAAGVGKFKSPQNDGTDILRNIERIQFSDGVVSLTGVQVTSLVGLTQSAASAALVAQGLTVGAVTTSFSATVASGSVISQNPPAGTFVPTGSAIDLVTSLGAPATAPNVVGSTQTAATTSLTAANLTVGGITQASSETVASGRVISQNPVAGTILAAGSPVSLVISTGSAGPALAATVSRDRAGNGALTSPSITPAANTLLVAFISGDASGGANAPAQIVSAVSNSGTAMTWTRAVRSNTQQGTAEVWWAFTPTARPATTVTATINGNVAATITVMAFTGAVPSVATGVATGAANGAPAGGVVTTGNSLVFAVGVDPAAGRAMVAGTGQTIVHQFATGATFTGWVQRITTPVVAAGTSVTMSDTYGATMPDRWNMAVVEIKKQ